MKIRYLFGCSGLCIDVGLFRSIPVKDFKYLDLIEQIKRDFKIDYYGDHGVNYWRRVYYNTQKLSSHYEIESEIFELFALLHDSKRHDEFEDKHHGKRAACFVEDLLQIGSIVLNPKSHHPDIKLSNSPAILHHNNPDVSDSILSFLEIF